MITVYFLNMDWENTNYNSVDAGGFYKIYRLNGITHRLDGPAETFLEDYRYYYAGLLHRVDGPAVDWNGKQSWWYHGVRTTKEFIELKESLKKAEADLNIYKNNITIYETFIDTLKNAINDTGTDEVVVSRKVIDAITECIKQ